MREIRFGNQTNPAEDFHATIHDIKVVVQRMPGENSLLYLTHGAPDMYKRATAYQIHFLRSLWVDHRGRLGLFIGNAKQKKQLVVPGQPENQNCCWQFDDSGEMQWTKPGVFKLDLERYIAIGVVMYPQLFRGSTKVEIDGEVSHKYVVGDRQVF